MDMSQTELADRAGVGIATVRRIESSENDGKGTVQVLMKIKKALEDAGVKFIDCDFGNGPGVRLKKG